MHVMKEKIEAEMMFKRMDFILISLEKKSSEESDI